MAFLKLQLESPRGKDQNILEETIFGKLCHCTGLLFDLVAPMLLIKEWCIDDEAVTSPFLLFLST